MILEKKSLTSYFVVNVYNFVTVVVVPNGDDLVFLKKVRLLKI